MRQRNVKNKKEIIETSKYFIEDISSLKGKWNEVYKNSNPIHIEIGMGKGKFIIENAMKYPNINFIGIEKFDSILALALKKVPDGLDNLKMIRLDASNIEDIFFKEIETIYLNFSDPWPKKRHEKRRLTSPEFLRRYDNCFKEKNHIIMKTDNKDLFSYSIKSLNNYGYYIEDITFDLHKLNDPDNIMTEYEEKFTKLNNPIYKIEVIKDKK
ncbi:MAG: tRNA (guanosine(46)-N7)-methyltransferase TrmB [Bacilli bacterium]|nr:tRNA (guanosine(46)-N7)-methyltransferase TrmB [Bacilli bacterium]MBQ8472772.1 tRNA (guanosine(46)-N7)-methyltransferase TrmB [Bacilli bacterium]